jgi:ectoine hydroxylase-related dioxygenase (phytanoyl-CoA dioxygenase family)
VDDWVNRISKHSELSGSTLSELDEVGFIVIPGPVALERLPQLAEAYDSAVLNAHPDDVAVGRSTTRVNDFVNRGHEFDELYVYGPILEACFRTIRQPFKLSTMHSRTVRPHAPEQDLHVDFSRDSDGWPMVGFILMVDEFRTNNGATRFVPGSHRIEKDPTRISRHEVLACGPAGSVVIYNGSVWHGHSANSTSQPRRSIQGAFIRRDAEPAVKQSTRVQQDTLGRVGRLQKYLLDL